MPATCSRTSEIPYLIGCYSRSLCTPPVDARTVRELLFATLETEVVGLEMHKPSDVIFEHSKSYFAYSDLVNIPQLQQLLLTLARTALSGKVHGLLAVVYCLKPKSLVTLRFITLP